MKKIATKFGTAILIGIIAAIFIRGVAGNEASHEDEIDISQAAAGVVTAESPEEVEESTPEDVIDLNNTLCPVMGGEVMDGQYVDWEGFRVHFCCGGCDARFLAEPEKYLPILAEEAAVAELLGIECGSCYPEDCSCEQPQSSSSGSCH
ncbi:MAG: hypothetical protein KAR44_02125 [Candidatus Aegiribacteria sp.]|nr:hypothetical protein [Candidatus Aegiribacteria sp.]